MEAAMLLDCLRLVFGNRREHSQAVSSDRRKPLFASGCKDANKKLDESVERLADAVTRAVERRK